MAKRAFTIPIRVIPALILLLAGCNRYSEPSPARPQGSSMLIQFTMPIASVGTRAIPAEAGENNINDLTLLFFDYSTNGTGSYAGVYRVPAEDIPSESEMYGELNNLFDLEVLFDYGSDLRVSEAYSILVFANMDGNYFTDMDSEFDDFISSVSRMTENDVKRTMIMYVSGPGDTVEAQYDNTHSMDRSNLPMSAGTTKEENATRIDCKMVRSVVRYDVINKTSGHTLISASIWNAFPRGYLFGDVDVNYGYNHLKRYYGLRNDSGLGDVHGGLYSFENVSTEPGPKDESTTCLIIGMAPADDIGDVTYYRVNINPQITGQYLLRNNVYQVTVSAVHGPGAGNEPDAYSSDDLLLDTSINSWDRDEDGLIVRNETHMMALPTKRANIGPEGDKREYFIYTMGEGTLEMTILHMPEGMQARLDGNFLHLDISPYDEDRRTGAVKFNFAGLSAVMEIVQTGDKGKILKLSHTQVPSWPAGWQWVNMLDGNLVRVDSSGPWTAEIYNGNFSFESGRTDAVILTGDNGDHIDEIYNTGINTSPDMRHSFALVTLDEDPENYRNVIVLTQLGSGTFTLTPSERYVTFKADGTLLSSTNRFYVIPGAETDTWTVEIVGNDAAVFSVDISPDTRKAGEILTGPGIITITSPGENSDGPKTAALVITHNNINEKAIALHKESYTLELSQTELTMPAAGGQTVDVRVISTDEGATWSGEIETNMASEPGMQPFLVGPDGEKVVSLTSLPVEGSFRVWMPGVDRRLTVNPVATVRVKLAGTSLEATLTVTQQLPEYTRIYTQTIRNSYGWWLSSVRDFYQPFLQWKTEMTDPANFGPAGTVYTPYIIDVSVQNEDRIVSTGGIAPRIFNMNGVTKNSIDYGTSRADPNTVFIVYVWEPSHYPFRYLGLDQYYTTAKPPVRNIATPRKVYKGNAEAMQTELWKYIFEEGPFGPVNVDQVVLYPQNFPAYMYCLTKWPETMIPLMMVPSNDSTDPVPNPSQLLLGVDPTNRIIWIGHKDMFGSDYGGSYNRNWDNPENVKFLRNLQAWMVNVCNYGDGFNERFKERVPQN